MVIANQNHLVNYTVVLLNQLYFNEICLKTLRIQRAKVNKIDNFTYYLITRDWHHVTEFWAVKQHIFFNVLLFQVKIESG